MDRAVRGRCAQEAAPTEQSTARRNRKVETTVLAPGTWDATLTLSTGAGLKGDVVLADVDVPGQ